MKREKFDIPGIREANEEPVTLYLANQKNIIVNNVYLFQKILSYSVCVSNMLTVDAYQKNAKIADHHVTVQTVVRKSVAAGMILINQQQLISTHRTHSSCFTYCLFYFCFIFWKILSYLFDVEFLQYVIFIFSFRKKLE